jgi:hypothetical protein
MDPLPKLTLQHSMADEYELPPRRNMSLVQTPLTKKNLWAAQGVGAGVVGVEGMMLLTGGGVG